MWEKLIELIVKKFLETKTPRRKAAKSFVNLYMAMTNCHETFKDYQQLRSTEAFVRWDKAVDALAGVLYDLRNVLHIYDPEVYRVIVRYTIREYQVMYSDRIVEEEIQRYQGGFTPPHRGMVPSQIFPEALEHYNERFSRLRAIARGHLGYGPRGEAFLTEGFDTALDKLRQFIKENFTVDEIL